VLYIDVDVVVSIYEIANGIGRSVPIVSGGCLVFEAKKAAVVSTPVDKFFHPRAGMESSLSRAGTQRPKQEHQNQNEGHHPASIIIIKQI
jgi:hypothetical protein